MSTVDESLAKALGCNLIPPDIEGWDRHVKFGGPMRYGYWRCGCEERDHADINDHRPQALIAYSTSFDACLRDIVPVLRARDDVRVEFDIIVDRNGCRVNWEVFKRDAAGDWSTIASVVSQPDIPAAFCEAALKALEATNGS